ncbi:MAG: glutathione synthase [Oscillospiraceae bacterium]|nr:glutathione synthase [Oscillospiraceae bacterium]
MGQYQYETCGGFGLERETLRVDANGALAQTPHPFGEDPHITRDFCENQIELITPVCHSVDEAVQALGKLDAHAKEVLAAQGEQLWLYSNPPHFETEDDIPIAAFTGIHSNKRNYREALERRYGKRLMLYSGIHFNFSFSEAQLQEYNTEHANSQSFRDALYLRLYQQLFRHSWLLVLLTAASPFYDLSLDGDHLHGIGSGQYGSLRCSERGYWNQFVPLLDHTDLHTFTEGIQTYVNKGLLFSASELYLPVRLKPKGENTLANLAEHGVDHIELRMFDLNPLTPLGVDADDLKFAHLLILYLASQPDTTFTPIQQEQAVNDHQAAAYYDPPQWLLSRAQEILSQMMRYFGNDHAALHILEKQHARLCGNRLCTQIRAEQIYR